MQGSGILFSEMTPPDHSRDEFHEWYDTHHIPVRMAVPGFLSARRYRAAESSPTSYLAVYEMTDLKAIQSDAYGVVKNQPSDQTRRMLAAVSGFTRYLGSEMSVRRKPDAGQAALDAPVLYAVWFTVPVGRLEDFDAWYETDHVPILMESPDWLMVRRFKITDGQPHAHNRLALHYLADHRAMSSEARERARNTPWRAKISSEPWFRGSYTVFDAHRPRQTGQVA